MLYDDSLSVVEDTKRVIAIMMAFELYLPPREAAEIGALVAAHHDAMQAWNEGVEGIVHSTDLDVNEASIIVSNVFALFASPLPFGTPLPFQE